MKKLTKEKFIKKSKKLHGDIYLYSAVNYINLSTEIILICKNHGNFIITPYKHLIKRKNMLFGGCMTCFIESKNSICTDCGLKRELNNRNRCKECVKENLRLMDKRNNEKKRKKEKNYINISRKICTKCKTEQDINNFGINKQSIDKHSTYCRKCYREIQNKNQKNNKDKNRINLNKRLQADPVYRCKIIARNTIRIALYKKKYTKKSHTYEILGCPYEEFKIYIENQFTDGMSWANKSLWHIDHIVPLSFGESEEEVLMLNHYRNLRPLWAVDNLLKSGDITDNTDLYYKILENRKRLK